jgi:hypothetical protein
MDIYISSNGLSQKHEWTPMHAYAATKDFATILNDIQKGELPVGTNKPFPVNFAEEEENPPSQFIRDHTSMFSNPHPSEIIGPRAFGL